MGDGGMRLFDWYFSDPNTTRAAEFIDPEKVEEARQTVGALVGGRRLYDNAHGWNGEHPLHVPFFIVTHHPPEVTGKINGKFVTDGVESALRQAQEVAGDKMVAVASPDVARHCLKAGLLDELSIHIVPVLLGGGVRLFDLQGIAPIELESIGVTEAPGVTHLRYRVVK